MYVVAAVRSVGVTLPHQRHEVSVRRAALSTHLRVVEVQQQPAEHHFRRVAGQRLALPGKRTVAAARYVNSTV